MDAVAIVCAIGCFITGVLLGKKHSQRLKGIKLMLWGCLILLLVLYGEQQRTREEILRKFQEAQPVSIYSTK